MESNQQCIEHLVAWEIVSTEQTADRIVYPTGHECFVFHGAAKVRCKCCGRIELIRNDIPFYFPPQEDLTQSRKVAKKGIGELLRELCASVREKVFHV